MKKIDRLQKEYDNLIAQTHEAVNRNLGSIEVRRLNRKRASLLAKIRRVDYGQK